MIYPVPLFRYCCGLWRIAIEPFNRDISCPVAAFFRSCACMDTWKMRRSSKREQVPSAGVSGVSQISVILFFRFFSGFVKMTFFIRARRCIFNKSFLCWLNLVCFLVYTNAILPVIEDDYDGPGKVGVLLHFFFHYRLPPPLSPTSDGFLLEKRYIFGVLVV